MKFCVERGCTVLITGEKIQCGKHFGLPVESVVYSTNPFTYGKDPKMKLFHVRVVFKDDKGNITQVLLSKELIAPTQEAAQTAGIVEVTRANTPGNLTGLVAVATLITI